MSSSGRSADKTAFIILGVVVVAVIVWILVRGNANRPAKATDAWKTITLSSEKLSFKIPPTWTMGDNDADEAPASPPQSISILSPATHGYYFSLEISSGTPDDVYKNFLGQSAGVTLLKLPAKGSNTPLYLIAQGTKPTVTGLALASTPGSNKTSFGIQDASGKGNNNITMSVNLVTSPPTAVPPPYSLKMYQSQPEYRDVLGIFNSLSFSR